MRRILVKYGVTAQGDKGMLESQVMYNIKATCNGVEVILIKGVEYELQIKGGNINWVKQSDKKYLTDLKLLLTKYL